MKTNDAPVSIIAPATRPRPTEFSRPVFLLLLALTVSTALLAINCHQRRPAEVGYAPPGFDLHLLEILACPENLTSLRLATRRELDTINARIRTRTLNHWNGTIVDRPVAAALIREDNRIAYEIRQGVPIMLIDQALVLDQSVGRPNPDKHRKTMNVKISVSRSAA